MKQNTPELVPGQSRLMPQTYLTTFKLFPQLPVEIRIAIWGYALEEPRFICASTLGWDLQRFGLSYDPSHSNVEARTVSKGFPTQLFHKPNRLPYRAKNSLYRPGTDILTIPTERGHYFRGFEFFSRVSEIYATSDYIFNVRTLAVTWKDFENFSMDSCGQVVNFLIAMELSGVEKVILAIDEDDLVMRLDALLVKPRKDSQLAVQLLERDFATFERYRMTRRYQHREGVYVRKSCTADMNGWKILEQKIIEDLVEHLKEDCKDMFENTVTHNFSGPDETSLTRTHGECLNLRIPTFEIMEVSTMEKEMQRVFHR